MQIVKYAVAASLIATAPLAAAQQLSIATGGTGGVYYPIGGGFAEIINEHLEGYEATAEVTGASVENMGLIMRGDADLALVLADTALQAYEGSGDFEGRQIENTRALASVYPNAVQLVTLADSDIESLADLEGKRVSVGAAPSSMPVPCWKPTASATMTSRPSASTSTRPPTPSATATSTPVSGAWGRPPARFSTWRPPATFA